MAIGVSGRPSVRETLAREKARMAQQQQQQGQFDPNKLAQGVLRGDVSSSDIASLQSLGALPQQQEIDIDTLLSRRGEAMEQNLDTSQLDQILAQAGYKPADQSQYSPEKTRSKIASLKISEKKPITNYTSALKELAKLKNAFSEAPSGAIGSVFKGMTGPVASLLGGIGPSQTNKELRTDLDVFQDKIRKDLFGSAFTETEKKVANLPGSGKQEDRNKRIINSLYNNKLNELVLSLENAGFSDNEINSYLQSQGILTGQVNATEDVGMAGDVNGDPLGLGI